MYAQAEAEVLRCKQDFLTEADTHKQLKSRHASALIEVAGLRGDLDRRGAEVEEAHRMVQALAAQAQELYVALGGGGPHGCHLCLLPCSVVPQRWFRFPY